MAEDGADCCKTEELAWPGLAWPAETEAAQGGAAEAEAAQGGAAQARYS